jgi:hypothetical protein
MPRIDLWLLAAVAFGLLSACAGKSAAPSEAAPAHLEPIADTGIARVTLTEKAFERLGIQTAPVLVGAARQSVVPYAAILYDVEGGTWVYANPAPLTFVRERVAVERIEGERALLSDGPAVGAEVVTVGVSELYGAEFEVGH